MTNVSELPKHVLSITRPQARHPYGCAWKWRGYHGCRQTIHQGDVYVRVVWQDDDDKVHSDHICVPCWSE